MGRILSIDYGQKRVGVAVTDPLKIIASALTTVHSKDIIQFLTEYFKTEIVECIVVGYAKQMNNEDSESMKYIKPFVNQLKQKFPEMKIVLFDERFTSKMAFQTMIDSGLKKKDRQNKSTLDKISATILLQDYLNTIK